MSYAARPPHCRFPWPAARHLRRLLAAVLWLVANSFAEERTQPASPAVDSSIAPVIEQLGAESYRLRERATRQLMDLGPSILPQVQAALDHEDAEVRLRCRRITLVITAADRADRLSRFSSGGSGDLEADLPGWASLQRLLGDSRESRQLLCDVLSHHWELLAEFEATGDEAATEYVARHIHHLQFLRRHHRVALPADAVTAVLLMCYDHRVDLPQQRVSQFLSILHQLSRTADGSNPWNDAEFCKLAGNLIQRCADPTTAYQSFTLALRHGLKDGLVPALTILNDPSSAPHVRQYAILTVARFGSSQHVEPLEPLLEDAAVCYRRSNSKTKQLQFECQIRDVALASVLHLLHQDPRQFGYEQLQRNAYSVFQPHSLGFTSDDERHAALEKWFVYRQH